MTLGLTAAQSLRHCALRRTPAMRRVSFALLSVLLLFVRSEVSAQSSTPLPYTMTTLGGTSPMSAASGAQCPNLPASAKSSDADGDGCLAVNAVFGAAGRGGIQVDSFGNVFVADDINSVIHV